MRKASYRAEVGCTLVSLDARLEGTAARRSTRSRATLRRSAEVSGLSSSFTGEPEGRRPVRLWLSRIPLDIA